MAYAGNIVRAGDFMQLGGEFDPEWANFTVGNGNSEGRWWRLGDGLIFVRAFMFFGSTSSVGGSLGFTLPGGKTAEAVAFGQSVPALAFDSSAAAAYAGFARVPLGGGTGVTLLMGPSSAAWAATVPFTWATNDFIQVQGIFEVTT